MLRRRALLWALVAPFVLSSWITFTGCSSDESPLGLEDQPGEFQPFDGAGDTPGGGGD